MSTAVAGSEIGLPRLSAPTRVPPWMTTQNYRTLTDGIEGPHIKHESAGPLWGDGPGKGTAAWHVHPYDEAVDGVAGDAAVNGGGQLEQILFEVPGWPPLKNEATSMLAVGHR
ncbi:MAG: hypothetical protein M3332_05495 [Actinomycetota bacterium]|nr:hypothetical protein [Actinomycetota bacterium]